MSEESAIIEDLEPEDTEGVVGGIAKPVSPVVPTAEGVAKRLAQPNDQPIAHPL